MYNLIELLKTKLPNNYQLILEIDDIACTKLLITLKHFRPSATDSLNRVLTFEELDGSIGLDLFTLTIDEMFTKLKLNMGEY